MRILPSRLGLGRLHIDHRPLAPTLLDRLADHLLNVPEVLQLVTAAEGDRHTLHACAACSTDAMDVGLGLLGNVIVDDGGQLDDINTARCNIGCNQHIDLARFEAIECRHTGILTFITVNSHCLDAVLGQLARHRVRAVLGAGKDECIGHAMTIQQIQ